MLTRVRPQVLHVGAWVVAAPFILWALVRVFGLDSSAMTVQLVSFTPYAAMAAVVPVGLALLVRRWWVAGVATAALVALLVCVLPRTFGSPSTMDGVPVTVMSTNMRYGGADVAAIMAVVRDQKVDIVAVQEFTPDAQSRLAGAGLGELMLYQVLRPHETTNGSALYSRYPLSETSTIHNGGGFYQVRGVVTVPGAAPVDVESVHPVPPMTANFVGWRQDLRDQRPTTPEAVAQILIGDFNSTLDHDELRQVLATGYYDAADSVGRGLTPTWPYDGARSSVTPKITIDHVLCDRRIGTTAFDAVTIPRTDHRAIVARLMLPRS
jgi:endonuclease/exonuclease/phosphatase family metal-dependent hydrolase